MMGGRAIVVVLLALVNLAGCNGSRLREVDDDAFVEHFAAQARCKAYLDGLIDPSTKALSKLSSVQEMRGWFEANPEDDFAKVVLKVRLESSRDRPIDLARGKDNDELVARMVDALEGAAGFGDSSCGAAAVQDIVVDSFYRGVDARRPSVSAWLSQGAALEDYRQRYLLMAIMLAPSGR